MNSAGDIFSGFGFNESCFFFSELMIVSRPSCPDQGTYASSRTWGGMRWTRMRSPDERRNWRTAKSCGPGTPRLVPSLSMTSLQATVTRTSRTPGRARSSVNTIAQGMPVIAARPVVTEARVVLFFPTRGYGCSSVPGIPCALASRGLRSTATRAPVAPPERRCASPVLFDD